MFARRIHPEMTEGVQKALGGEDGWAVVYRADRASAVKVCFNHLGAIALTLVVWGYVLISESPGRFGGNRTRAIATSFQDDLAANGWHGVVLFELAMIVVAALPMIGVVAWSARNAAQWISEKVPGPRIVRGLVERNEGGYGSTAHVTIGGVALRLRSEGRLVVPIGYEAVAEYVPLEGEALLIHVRKPAQPGA